MTNILKKGSKSGLTLIKKGGETSGPEPPPLLGDRIAAMTKAVGIKPCGGCKKRQAWLNDKHQQLRERINGKTEESP